MLNILVARAATAAMQAAAWSPSAPFGTGLEWMTIMAVVLPAVLLLALVYQGAKSTV